MAKYCTRSIKLLGIIEILINHIIATTSAKLPDHHNEPFDRLIIATAQVNNLSIVTCDNHIKRYDEIKVIW